MKQLVVVCGGGNVVSGEWLWYYVVGLWREICGRPGLGRGGWTVWLWELRIEEGDVRAMTIIIERNLGGNKQRKSYMKPSR